MTTRDVQAPPPEVQEELAALAISLAAMTSNLDDTEARIAIAMQRMVILHLSRGHWEDGPSSWLAGHTAKARTRFAEAARTLADQVEDE